MTNKIIAIAGPTASGKTALAVELAKKVKGEVISCDSMQIYKRMNIGTAKPSPEEQSGIPHHMIDIIEPEQRFSVADFVDRARGCIDDCLKRGAVPILAGGTGLYMDSVINNIDFADFEGDSQFCEEMRLIAEQSGVDELHRRLMEVDPVAAEKIHPNNVRRVIRALEVCHVTGKTFTEMNEISRRKPIYDALVLGIEVDREVLYDRINRRVDLMMEMGLENEVRGLVADGIGRDTTAMQAIGYKELLEYIDGAASLSDAVEKIKQESRRYAKRQLTWFRRNADISWVRPDDAAKRDEIFKMCLDFLGI